MEVDGVHIIDNDFDLISQDSNDRTPASSSNDSWPSGDHPIEMLARKEAIKQLKSIDLDRLSRLAARIKGEGECTALTSMTCIGAANVVIFLEFNDTEATRWIARFPLIGRLTDSTDLLAELIESMVATMQFVSDRTSIPLPKIHHWDSTFSNELGRPYVIMDAAKGNSLYELEHVSGFNMDETVNKLGSFVNQWALYNAELATLQFQQIGSLQRAEDDLYVNRLCSQANVYYTDLVEGDKYRGPFNSVTDYLLSTSELKCRALPSATNVLKRYTYHDFLQSKLVESMLTVLCQPKFSEWSFRPFARRFRYSKHPRGRERMGLKLLVLSIGISQLSYHCNPTFVFPIC